MATRGLTGKRGYRGRPAVEMFHRPVKPLWVRVLALMWRLRAEAIVLIAGIVVWYELTTRLPHNAVMAILIGTPLLVLAYPDTRRFVVCRFWCTISRHRLRACFVQIRAMNHDGLLPWFLWVRPTAIGERAYLLLRPGIAVTDLEDRLEHIAVSCWAREARVQRSRRFAALVMVDVIRRDPLTGKRAKAIPSPLLHIGAGGPKPPPVELTAIPEPITRPETAKPDSARADRPDPEARPRRNNRTSSQGDEPILRHGKDLDDYV